MMDNLKSKKIMTRNFAILSHIDHGKSTLADRLLEITKTVPPGKMRPQFLDMMELEREKGITIKMQPVRMEYQLNGVSYVLNLIDTPGHVDFSYEVSRSLAAVDGVILLVDATKGIQAQTLANLKLAREQNLVIVPAVNKIDMPQAMIQETQDQIASVLEMDPESIFKISAKLGTGVEDLLRIVIEQVPPPKINTDKPLRALIFDSKYDSYKGVIVFVKIVDGEIRAGDRIYLMAQKTTSEVVEVGFFKPEMASAEYLASGDIGYIATGIKEPGKVRVGDTIIKESDNDLSKRSLDQSSHIEQLPGYREPKSMVYLSVYPENPDDYEELKESLDKLLLTDPALTIEPEMKEILGRGFRCGFLGSLHAEIITERLFREFGMELVISTPSVAYQIVNSRGEEVWIRSAIEWPQDSMIKESKEPWVKLEVLTPNNYLGAVMEITSALRGNYLETKYFSGNVFLLIYEVPLIEVITGFYEKLKSVSQGYASLNYEFVEYRKADLIKMEILIAEKKEEAFSRIVPRQSANREAREFLIKLKDNLPAQLFSVPLQAVIGGTIIARETMSAKGKDVTGALYGGDYSRKKKLLERQKKGKKELKEKGRVRIPPKVFFEMMRK
ncbi:MAG: translation elongation factor 4 [bacterium]